MVAFTAFNRVNYMRESLASWSRVRGVTDTVFDFHVEPGCPDMEALCRSITFTESVVHVNTRLNGVQRNPYEALNCGFCRWGGSDSPKPDDFVILAEDDFIVSTDVLEWFSWARQEFYHDSRVMFVSASQFEEQPGGLVQALFIPWFAGWVWGTWRDRWEGQLRPDWTFDYEHDGWDWRFIRHWCGERGKLCVVPAISRSQHIGEHGGVHTIPGQWFRDQQSRCFQPEVPVQQYRSPAGVSLVPNPRGLVLVRLGGRPCVLVRDDRPRRVDRHDHRHGHPVVSQQGRVAKAGIQG